MDPEEIYLFTLANANATFAHTIDRWTWSVKFNFLSNIILKYDMYVYKYESSAKTDAVHPLKARKSEIYEI